MVVSPTATLAVIGSSVEAPPAGAPREDTAPGSPTGAAADVDADAAGGGESSPAEASGRDASDVPDLGSADRDLRLVDTTSAPDRRDDVSPVLLAFVTSGLLADGDCPPISPFSL